jgi:hypothetical protein
MNGIGDKNPTERTAQVDCQLLINQGASAKRAGGESLAGTV